MSDEAGDLKSFDCWCSEDSDPDGPVDVPTPFATGVQRLVGLSDARAAEAYAELLFYGNAESETDAEDGEDTYEVYVRDPAGKVKAFTGVTGVLTTCEVQRIEPPGSNSDAARLGPGSQTLISAQQSLAAILIKKVENVWSSPPASTTCLPT